MPTFQSDYLIQDALRTAVDGTSTYTSMSIQMSGVQSISIQAQCFNGSAGTLYIDGCNQPVPSGNNQLPANAPVSWLNFSSQVLTTNQQAVLAYSLADQLTTMHNMRVRFVSNAPGNILVSVNARRISD